MSNNIKKGLGIFFIMLPFISIITFLIIINDYKEILISIGIALFLITAIAVGVYLLFKASEESDKLNN